MNRKLVLGIIGLMVVAFLGGVAFAQEAKPIIGKIDESGQLAAEDGKVYAIGSSGKGAALADMKGKKVSVTGTVAEKEGKMTIEVSDFQEVQ